MKLLTVAEDCKDDWQVLNFPVDQSRYPLKLWLSLGQVLDGRAYFQSLWVVCGFPLLAQLFLHPSGPYGMLVEKATEPSRNSS